MSQLPHQYKTRNIPYKLTGKLKRTITRNSLAGQLMSLCYLQKTKLIMSGP